MNHERHLPHAKISGRLFLVFTQFILEKKINISVKRKFSPPYHTISYGGQYFDVDEHTYYLKINIIYLLLNTTTIDIVLTICVDNLSMICI